MLTGSNQSICWSCLFHAFQVKLRSRYPSGLLSEESNTITIANSLGAECD